jgi:hypothetical protein
MRNSALLVAALAAIGTILASAVQLWAAQADTLPRAGVVHARRPDPQSQAFLDLIRVDLLDVVRKRSGQDLALIELVPIAEAPDYNPRSDLDQLRVEFRQVEGPSVAIVEPHSARASVVLPEVEAPRRLSFEFSIGNRSGVRRGRIDLEVRPRR